MSKQDVLHGLKPAECEIEYDTIKMPCPNCFSFGLIRTGDSEACCMDCGREFILIGRNTLRFK